MVVAQVDCGYSASNTTDISKEILDNLSARTSINEVVKPNQIREAFLTVQRASYYTDTGRAWDFIETNRDLFATNISGGILIRGNNLSKFSIQQESKTSHSIVNFGSKLALIKETFSLTNEELAEILSSGRKTVHNWMTASNSPSRTKAKRILELDDIANMWIQRGYSATTESLIVPGQSGYSLIELLSHSKLDKDLVMFHGSSMYLGNNEEELEDPFA